ncbi:hypothetical protein BC829DRAFT_64368 [Chytridium lagenaria]|nr:hypothetical protein BC829DRAFT_64368 [Chytridium lagenaria]
MTDCPALIRAFPTLARSNPNDCCQPILGVVCNSAGRITELRVANAVRAGGATMGDLSSLTELTVLDLSNNQFTGAIPGWIYQLTKLTNLRLGANRLTGSLSSSIGNLLELQELNVFSNQLSGPLPASLNRLTQMSLLILSANSFSGNVPNLSNLRSLASLQLPIIDPWAVFSL